MLGRRILPFALALALTGCGDDDGTGPTDVTPTDMGGGADMSVAMDSGPDGPPRSIGPADRPAAVNLPGMYDPEGNYPIVVMLHGYGATGAIQSSYLGLRELAREMGFVAIIPDGMADASDRQFWNATDACCDFASSGVDDVGYISGLIDKALEVYGTDPDRVYLIGHSNGGFMSYRMACDASDKITAIASLAGATWGDAMDCGDPAEPVSVLQMHGTADSTIPYEGGAAAAASIPSARGSVERFAERSGCDISWTTIDPLDFDSGVAGDETVREEITEGCAAGTDYALWTIEGGSHIPTFAEGAIEAAMNWLLAHSSD